MTTKVRREDLEMCNLEGLNRRECASKLGVSSSNLYRACRIYALKFNKEASSINKNNNYFELIDNEEKAYILGFIVADGSVNIEPKKRNGVVYSYSKRLSFCNSIDDDEAIILVRDAISPETKIRYIHNPKGAKLRKMQSSLRFNSERIVDDLMTKYNINPRKTQDINFRFPFESIPKELVRHFLRGFFDGDGWITKDGNVGFVSTSKDFLIQIQDILDIKTGKSTIVSTKGKNMVFHQLLYNSKATSKLYWAKKLEFKLQFVSEFYNYLYANSNYYLSRKRTKFVNKIKANTEVISRLNSLKTP